VTPGNSRLQSANFSNRTARSFCLRGFTQKRFQIQRSAGNVGSGKALLEAQDTNRPKHIAEVGQLERPSEEQEIHKPAVGKSRLVKAAAPSK
jgi:hypothetical protein